MAPVKRVEGADEGALVAIDATSGAGGLPVDISEVDVYYFAPQKCFASDGGLWIALMSPGRAGAGRGDHRVRPLDPGVPGPGHRDRQLDQAPDLQHPVAGHAVPDGRADRLDQQPRRPGLERRPDAPTRRIRLYTWAEKSDYATPYVEDPDARSLVIGTVDLDDAIDAAAVAKTLRANGIVDTEPYRKLGRNQLRVAMFPAVDPDDVEKLTQAIDFVVDRLK